ncbi:carbohydrate sulfotransferase 15 isoform X2 [Patella vulgata]|nr:carbohydrate sulfotransferase 15 isoform X2 [Patella vulgata]
MMLHHLFPATKIIVILRNPTDRLYSDYVYFRKNVSQEQFHDYCKQSIILFKECEKKHGVRYCVHNSSIVNQFKVRIHIGLYSIYMADWLDVFPRNQILPIKLDDYSKNPTKTFTEIFSFLGVASLNQEEIQKIIDGAKKNVGTRKQNMGAMKSETRTMLNKFHAPFNKVMAVQMKDETFLWLRE